MEEDFWFAQQQSRVLQEFRAEIRPLWTDSAAREFDVRYLDEHADEDREMVDAFAKQLAAVNAFSTRLQAALQISLALDALSQGIHEHIELSRQEIHTADQTYEECRQQASIVNDRFREIASLIDESNRVCNGVPTS